MNLYFPSNDRIKMLTLELVLLLLLSLVSQGFVVLSQEVCVLLVGRLLELSFLPQIRGQESVGLSDSSVSGLG